MVEKSRKLITNTYLSMKDQFNPEHRIFTKYSLQITQWNSLTDTQINCQCLQQQKYGNKKSSSIFIKHICCSFWDHYRMLLGLVCYTNMLNCFVVQSLLFFRWSMCFMWNTYLPCNRIATKYTVNLIKNENNLC